MTQPSATSYPKKRDGKRWSTSQPLVGTCRNGHPWATYAYTKKDGQVFCKRCCLDRKRERYSLSAKFPSRMQPAEVRLLQRINKTPGQGPNGDCWTYTGETLPAKGGKGYGQIERNGMAKLKWDWVRAIRKERSESGLSFAKLALKFNTTSGNISNIVNNKAWRESA